MKMMLKKNLNKKINVILWILIFLYPFINSFLGIDLGDTGTHYLNFENLFSNPEIVGFSSFFTSLIGWLWLQLFGGLGIWGLNLLEVFLEWGLAVIVFNFLKKYLNNTFLLIGILVSIVASGCYLNVFNYHQFSVFLITIMLVFIFKSLEQDKVLYSCLAGVFLGLAIGARISSLSCLSCVAIYIIWFCLSKNSNIKKIVCHIACFLLFCIIVCLTFLAIIKMTGLWQYFMDSMFRLGEMSSDSTGLYSLPLLIEDLVIGNLKTIASGLLTIIATVFFAVSYNFALKKCTSIQQKIAFWLSSILICFTAIYIGIYAYDINPVDGSPQFTTGPNYLSGILYSVLFILIIVELAKENYNCNKIILYLISVLLPLLIVAGSSTQTKHIIISMWLIAPITVDVIGRIFVYGIKYNIAEETKLWKISLRKYTIIIATCFFVLLVGCKFLHMIYWTNNFDSTKRLSITESIDSPAVKYLKTTEREADAVNDIIKYLNENDFSSDSTPMMVFGQGINLYNILDGTPYVRPWVTNSAYSTTEFSDDINNKLEENNIPIVIYCRTNQYFGFEEADYEWQLSLEYGTTYNGKKDVLKDFLAENNYRLVVENDYYYVFSTVNDEQGIGFDEYNYLF